MPNVWKFLFSDMWREACLSLERPTPEHHVAKLMKASEFCVAQLKPLRREELNKVSYTWL